MKKLISLILLVLILLVSSCQYITGKAPGQITTNAPITEPLQTATPQPATVPESELPFYISDSPYENQYLPGKEILFGYWIANTSSGTITLSPLGPATRIISIDRNEVVYSSPSGGMNYDLTPASPTFLGKDPWDQKDNNGNQVVPGRYKIIYDFTIIEQSTSRTYTANMTTRFIIADPESAMTKDLSVNQTVTNNGLTVTLQRLELNAVSGTATIFFIPSGYSLPEEHGPGQFEKLGDYVHGSTAEYSVDGDKIKELTNTNSMFDKSGVTLYWHNIDPVPLNAKELMLTIKKLGGQEGRWEFSVPLK